MPNITNEIRNVLKKMKRNKATDENGVVIEAIKIGRERLQKKIKGLLNLCLHQNEIPTRNRS